MPIIRNLSLMIGELKPSEARSAAIVEKLLNEMDHAILHLFKGQALLDKLNLERDLNEEEKNVLSMGSEKEFNGIIKSYPEGISTAYLGLLNLYSSIGDSEKMNSLVLTLLNKPKIFRDIFTYNIRYDTSKAIYLLEHWKEANPYDKEAASLLERLRISNR